MPGNSPRGWLEKPGLPATHAVALADKNCLDLDNCVLFPSTTAAFADFCLYGPTYLTRPISNAGNDSSISEAVLYLNSFRWTLDDGSASGWSDGDFLAKVNANLELSWRIHFEDIEENLYIQSALLEPDPKAAYSTLKDFLTKYHEDFQEELRLYGDRPAPEISPTSVDLCHFSLMLDTEQDGQQHVGKLTWPRARALKYLKYIGITNVSAFLSQPTTDERTGVYWSQDDHPWIVHTLSKSQVRKENERGFQQKAYAISDSFLLTAVDSQRHDPSVRLACHLARELGALKRVLIKEDASGIDTSLNLIPQAAKERLESFLPAGGKTPARPAPWTGGKPKKPAALQSHQSTLKELALPSKNDLQAHPRAGGHGGQPAASLKSETPARSAPPQESKQASTRVGPSKDVAITLRHEHRTKTATVPLIDLLGTHRDFPRGSSMKIKNCEPLHGSIRCSNGLGNLSAVLDVSPNEIPKINEQRWKNLGDDEPIGYYVLYPYVLLQGASPWADKILDVVGLRPGGYIRKVTKIPASGRGAAKQFVYLTNMKDEEYVRFTLRSIEPNPRIRLDPGRARPAWQVAMAGMRVKVETRSGSLLFGTAEFPRVAEALNTVLQTPLSTSVALPVEFTRRLAGNELIWLQYPIALMKNGADEFIISLPNAFSEEQNDALYASNSRMDYWLFNGDLRIVPKAAAELIEYVFLGELLSGGAANKKKSLFRGDTVEITEPTRGVFPTGRDEAVEAWTAFLKSRGKSKVVVVGAL